MESILDFHKVTKTFETRNGELDVLRGIDFSLKEGEIIAILGPSGCGKSTILNLACHLIVPTSGTIESKGEIGYMFQKDNLMEWRNVLGNVIIGLEIKHQWNETQKESITRLLKKYDLWDFRYAHPKELSGGMRQRVALIRTLALNPSILLLDEPFSALDYQTKLSVQEDVYKIIRKEKKSTVMVTHDISEAIAMADRVLILSPRPSHIKKNVEIHLELAEEKTPITARHSPNFKDYFDEFWKELNQHDEITATHQ